MTREEFKKKILKKNFNASLKNPKICYDSITKQPKENKKDD